MKLSCDPILRPRWFVGETKSPWSFANVIPSRSSEQSTKRRSRSENMWKVCLFCSQNNKIVWLSNAADTFLEKFTKCAKVCGLFFLDCAFGMLIGWAGKLWSRGDKCILMPCLHETHLPGKLTFLLYCVTFFIVKWHLPRVNVSRINTA